MVNWMDAALRDVDDITVGVLVATDRAETPPPESRVPLQLD
jgi:hypothetical protein